MTNPGYEELEARLRKTVAPWRDQIKGPVLADLAADALADLRKQRDEARAAREKIAPVQGYSAGIPWSMHLRAYDAYCKKYGKQPALIDLEGKNCRGGFGVGELDDFIPGWRDELSELSTLRAENERLTRERDEAIDNVRQLGDLYAEFEKAAEAEVERLRKVAEGERHRCLNEFAKTQLVHREDIDGHIEWGRRSRTINEVEAAIRALPPPALTPDPSSKED